VINLSGADRINLVSIFSLSNKSHTKMKAIALFFIGLFFLPSLLISQSGQYTYSSSKFEGKFADYLEPGEKEVFSWYHYVISKNEEGEYIRRIFYPETKQIVAEEHIAGKKSNERNGPARYWYEDGVRSKEGAYSNNQFEGPWTFYHRKNGEVSQTGNFEKGKKTGLWKYFDKQGRLEETCYYEKGDREGAFVQYDSLQNVINKGVYKADTIFSQTKEIEKEELKVIETMPFLSSCRDLAPEERQECTQQNLLQYIYRNIRYPASAREYGIEGRVIVQFVVEKDGSVSEPVFFVSLCQDIRDEVLRVLAGMPKWEPGTIDGEVVRVSYTLPVYFRLE
jgi:antitoxin component YwqK of YwqJK toxin-antitoxin module